MVAHDMMAETGYLELPSAPEIPGLEFRLFRGPEDYGAITELSNVVAVHDGLDWRMNEEMLAVWWAPGADFVPTEDVVIAEIGGRAVACGIAGRPQAGMNEALYPVHGRVRPEWRRRGIGRALRLRSEEHARRRHQAVADQRPAYFVSYCRDGVVPSERQLKNGGYKPARHYFYMLRRTLGDIGSAALPAGIEVRPVERDHWRLIHAAETEAFRDHWGTPEFPYEVMESEASVDGAGPDMWVVAWEGDQVVGSVRNLIDAQENAQMGRLRGYNNTVSVRRPWRGRGIARALLNRSLILLRDRGMTESWLRVDTDNSTGALRLYESCGFAVNESETEYRKQFA